MIAFHDIVKHPPETGCKVAGIGMRLKMAMSTSRSLRTGSRIGLA